MFLGLDLGASCGVSKNENMFSVKYRIINLQ